MASRMVPRQATTLPLSNGDNLIVRTRLSHGDLRAAYARTYVAGVDGEMRVNPLLVGDAMLVAYLIDWTLTDPQGQPIVIRDQPPAVVQQALDDLFPEDVAEIRRAVDQHEQRMREARLLEKKLPDGSNGDAPTLSSPSVPAGTSNASVN